MKSDMSKIPIREYLDLYGDGIHGTPEYAADGEYYFINGNNIKDGRINIDDSTLKVTRREYEKIKRPLSDNSLLVSINGTLGNIGVYNGEKIALGKSACFLNVKEECNKYFVKYLLSTKEFQKYIMLVAHGSTIKNLAPSQIADYVPELPDDIDVDRVASLLKSIDDKIERNKHIVNTLEQMAKTLYDYWFVQFDFPDANGTPYKTSGGKMEWNETLSREIPAGWEVSTIGRHVEVDRGISYSSADLEGEGIPMVNLNSFNTDASYKVEGLKTYSGKYAKDKVIKPYDLMICTTQQTAIDLTGQTNIIGKAMILPDCFEGREVVASMDLVRLHCDDIYGKYYLRLLLAKDYFHKYVTGYAIGTKIKHLHLDGLLNYYCEVPPNSLLQSFNKKMQDIEMKKSEIINENQRLCYLRDFLLPMLMNGQVTFRQ